MREYVHAAKVCSQIENGITAAAARMQRALDDIRAEFETMRGIINEGRAARGLPPLP